ncbi:MAG: NYN domain-containing protein, partial [Casimicrobiaceae bacterium]|nr:NYN domain-containing protein [Casimicrobiaceae bacterium]
MERNDVAVFYDIENLLKGIENARKLYEQLKLKVIRERIAEALGPSARLAVQRAYADWSGFPYCMLRSGLVEALIEPVQIFAFNRMGTKNAADIELALDAVQLGHDRPHIGTIVIVS